MNRIELDLNNPQFLNVFLELRGKELEQVARALHRLGRYSWDDVYKLPGLNWENIRQVTVNGQPTASIRLSKKYRAIVIRERNILRILSLHLDHDSAYE
jgi:hypothetical protein